MTTIYRCWNPDSGEEEDGKDISKVYDAAMAATEFAEWYDPSSDYTYATIGGEVCVREGNGPVQTFVITTENCPLYHASEVK